MVRTERRDTTVDARPVDPRVARSRAVILAAATEQFLAQGYLAANVDEIAEIGRAHV